MNMVHKKFIFLFLMGISMCSSFKLHSYPRWTHLVRIPRQVDDDNGQEISTQTSNQDIDLLIQRIDKLETSGVISQPEIVPQDPEILSEAPEIMSETDKMPGQPEAMSESELNPQTPEPMFQSTDLVPQDPEVISEPELVPQDPEILSEAPEIMSETDKMSGQPETMSELELNPQTPELMFQSADLVPQAPEVISEPDVMPEAPEVMTQPKPPESNKVGPKTTQITLTSISAKDSNVQSNKNEITSNVPDIIENITQKFTPFTIKPNSVLVNTHTNSENSNLPPNYNPGSQNMYNMHLFPHPPPYYNPGPNNMNNMPIFPHPPPMQYSYHEHYYSQFYPPEYPDYGPMEYSIPEYGPVYDVFEVEVPNNLDYFVLNAPRSYYKKK